MAASLEKMSASPSPEGLAEILRQLVALARDEKEERDQLAARSEDGQRSQPGGNGSDFSAAEPRTNANKALDV